MQAQYVECPITASLPAELEGTVLFQDVQHLVTVSQGNRVGQTAKSPEGAPLSKSVQRKGGSSFKFDSKRAINGIGGGSAYESRGDGLLEGGKTATQR